MSIHIKTGNRFSENKNSGERVYDFFTQRMTKVKSCWIWNLYFPYITRPEYLMAITPTNNKRYDIFNNKNSIFLFYNFKDYLDRQSWLTERVRHSIVSKDEHELLKRQRDNWPYFIKNAHKERTWTVREGKWTLQAIYKFVNSFTTWSITLRQKTLGIWFFLQPSLTFNP